MSCACHRLFVPAQDSSGPQMFAVTFGLRDFPNRDLNPQRQLTPRRPLSFLGFALSVLAE